MERLYSFTESLGATKVVVVVGVAVVAMVVGVASERIQWTLGWYVRSSLLLLPEGGTTAGPFPG